MIRRATLADLQECTDLGIQFHAYSPWSQFPADRDHLSEFMAGIIEHGVLFLSDDGFIGGILNPLYFNRNIVTLAEMFWFAGREGTALREAFEAWGHEQGVVGFNFSGIADEHAPAIARVFRRAGYHPVETGFFKRVA
jgi:hypothetical protein